MSSPTNPRGSLEEPSLVLQGEAIALSIANGGALRLLDRATGLTWQQPSFLVARPGTVELTDSSGRLLTVELDGRSAQIEPLGATSARVQFGQLIQADGATLPARVSATVAIGPAGDRIEVTIEAVEVSEGFRLESVIYPAHFGALRTTLDDGDLVVPSRQGVLFPTRLNVGFMRYMHNTWRKITDQRRRLNFEGAGLNMPWYGLTKRVDGKTSGLLIDVETPTDASLDMIGNAFVGEVRRYGPQGEPREVGEGARLASASTVWKSSFGQLAYARRATFTVIPNGTYVEFAHRYRERAKASGRFRSLREKIAENPLVERLIGAPDIKIWICTHRPHQPNLRSYTEPVLDGTYRINTTFAQLTEIVRDVADGLKLERALILIGGWAREGFDNGRPDIWPPCPDAGDVGALREAAQLAAARGYVFALEDNYQDLYRCAPSFSEDRIIRRRDGSLVEGGIWEGGICYVSCSKEWFDLAHRNMGLVREHLSPNGYYFDTTAATPLNECFAPAHPSDRANDRENKIGLIQAARDYGWVIGVESGCDYANAVTDYYEGMPGAAVGYWEGVVGTECGIAVPLWPLVYHDSVVCYWQHGMPYGREDHANHVLSDLLWGYPSNWSLDASQWAGLRELIRQTCDLVGTLHRATAHEPLVEHQFLTPDYQVQTSRFGDGTSVWVNFGMVPHRLADGREVPARGFVTEGPALGNRRGSFDPGFRLEG